MEILVFIAALVVVRFLCDTYYQKGFNDMGKLFEKKLDDLQKKVQTEDYEQKDKAS